jgi:hypothetical protein
MILVIGFDMIKRITLERIDCSSVEWTRMKNCALGHVGCSLKTRMRCTSSTGTAIRLGYLALFVYYANVSNLRLARPPAYSRLVTCQSCSHSCTCRNRVDRQDTHGGVSVDVAQSRQT